MLSAKRGKGLEDNCINAKLSILFTKANQYFKKHNRCYAIDPLIGSPISVSSKFHRSIDYVSQHCNPHPRILRPYDPNTN